MEINSKKVSVQKSAQELCDYLSDVKNFENLMPDNITKFEVIREDAFVFALSGMPEIALEIKEVTAPTKVVLGAISDKIPFTLTGNISEVSESTSEAELKFEGNFNPMMAMMVKGPITKFLETLSTKMGDLS
ncbi:SRPBCC family protein [Aureisphaera sp.]